LHTHLESIDFRQSHPKFFEFLQFVDDIFEALLRFLEFVWSIGGIGGEIKELEFCHGEDGIETLHSLVLKQAAVFCMD
jgi:hypothetical protein